ncbi:MAG: tetratricopeptide repeat protein [Candidatus Mcinerneyibacterium aminivorans]|uniref:Tetratricopeptide repeat protein n=1 Tax=Candidatus Mcinerneyibacterium aminivorans TaxID=2703815 RepID=A0A5D0MBK0_9BACT|nr:MAG: tetratricopeptide repeat protein [Candidatus Mcinerneyibacterium aminivorans]
MFYFYIKEKKILCFLALFFPFIGYFVLFLLEYFNIIAKRSDIINDYEKYIRYKSQGNSLEDVNVQKELNTMSFLDKLGSVPDYKKRDVMIEFLVNDVDIKVSLLKMALKDDNPEVVHYASSTLNMLEEQFEKLIDEYKGVYSFRKDLDALKNLEKIYYEYINSGLLEKEVQNSYRNEHCKILKRIISDYGSDYDVQIKLAENYIEMKKIDSALNLLEELKNEFGDRYEIFKLLLKIHYIEKDIDKILKLTQQIKESDISVPERDEPLINFWR